MDITTKFKKRSLLGTASERMELLEAQILKIWNKKFPCFYNYVSTLQNILC